MDTFTKYFNLGLWHPADTAQLPLALFFIVLLAVYSLRDFRRAFMLTAMMALSVFLGVILSTSGLFTLPAKLLIFIKYFLVVITASVNIIGSGRKPSIAGRRFLFACTVIFGLLHGMGLNAGYAFFPALYFGMGLLVCFCILGLIIILIMSLVDFLGADKRISRVVICSVIIGLAIPYLIKYFPFTVA